MMSSVSVDIKLESDVAAAESHSTISLKASPDGSVLFIFVIYLYLVNIFFMLTSLNNHVKIRKIHYL